MSWQRRNSARWARVYTARMVADNRGNETRRAFTDEFVRARAVESFDRSNRAELPGEQGVSLVKILVDADIDVDLGSRVVFEDDGSVWDVYAPPAYRHGATRNVRHQSLTLRARPDDGGFSG